MIVAGFLRGINVGGHHKVQMAQLRQELINMGYNNVKTLLNSGNILFESEQRNIETMQSGIETHLTKTFHFPIPVILKRKIEIIEFLNQKPFDKIKIHKDLRLYVSFLKNKPDFKIDLPYRTSDNSFQIISQHDRIICSILDLSINGTSNGMKEMETLFGKNMTTRNWNTVLKLMNI